MDKKEYDAAIKGIELGVNAKGEVVVTARVTPKAMHVASSEASNRMATEALVLIKEWIARGDIVLPNTPKE